MQELTGSGSDWEHVYLYTTPLFGTEIVKVCLSSQSVSKFRERTNKFYPEPIVIHIDAIHPVNQRSKLELHLAEYIINNNGFYKSACINSLDIYLAQLLLSPEILNLQARLTVQFNNLCEINSEINSNKKDVNISDVIERIKQVNSCTDVPYLLAHTLLTKNNMNNRNCGSNNTATPLRCCWQQDTNAIYHAFIEYYMLKKNHTHTIRFADVLIAARKWFVFEENKSGHKIPHKAARQSVLEKLLTEKYGTPTRPQGKGLKDTVWEI